MQLVEIKDKNRWNEFVGAQAHAEFLQSWEWGEFQEKVEGKVLRFGIEENGELIAAATLINKSLPLGMDYFYCPRGPIFSEKLKIKNEKSFEFFIAEVRKIAEKDKVVFLRFEPNQIEIPNTKYQIRKTIDIQVSRTIILDLNLSEEELLKNMHQKTRYNIRLAEKKGVKIREAGIDEFDKFWTLMSATVNRDGFRLHSQGYYQKMLAQDGNFIKLYFGEAEGKILCAGIFCFFGDTAVYLHGASSNENRELMAPHLLQWQLIRKAKAIGCKYYDFSGIDDKKYPGVTRFKRGFAGQEIRYPGTFDVLFDKFKYSIYEALRKVRRLF